MERARDALLAGAALAAHVQRSTPTARRALDLVEQRLHRRSAHEAVDGAHAGALERPRCRGTARAANRRRARRARTGVGDVRRHRLPVDEGAVLAAEVGDDEAAARPSVTTAWRRDTRPSSSLPSPSPSRPSSTVPPASDSGARSAAAPEKTRTSPGMRALRRRRCARAWCSVGGSGPRWRGDYTCRAPTRSPGRPSPACRPQPGKAPQRSALAAEATPSASVAAADTSAGTVPAPCHHLCRQDREFPLAPTRRAAGNVRPATCFERRDTLGVRSMTTRVLLGSTVVAALLAAAPATAARTRRESRSASGRHRKLRCPDPTPTARCSNGPGVYTDEGGYAGMGDGTVMITHFITTARTRWSSTAPVQRAMASVTPSPSLGLVARADLLRRQLQRRLRDREQARCRPGRSSTPSLAATSTSPAGRCSSSRSPFAVDDGRRSRRQGVRPPLQRRRHRLDRQADRRELQHGVDARQQDLPVLPRLRRALEQRPGRVPAA